MVLVLGYLVHGRSGEFPHPGTLCITDGTATKHAILASMAPGRERLHLLALCHGCLFPMAVPAYHIRVVPMIGKVLIILGILFIAYALLPELIGVFL